MFERREHIYLWEARWRYCGNGISNWRQICFCSESATVMPLLRIDPVLMVNVFIPRSRSIAFSQDQPLPVNLFLINRVIWRASTHIKFFLLLLFWEKNY